MRSRVGVPCLVNSAGVATLALDVLHNLRCVAEFVSVQFGCSVLVSFGVTAAIFARILSLAVSRFHFIRLTLETCVTVAHSHVVRVGGPR